jgi:hypothetical protein
VPNRFRRELGLIVGWLVFPLVPVILEDAYCQTSNVEVFGSLSVGPDPLEWDWFLWVIMLGPLLGYGFLAGATMNLSDDLGRPRSGLRRLLARRSVWVAISPWSGFLVLSGIFLLCAYLQNHFVALGNLNLPESWRGTWIETFVNWALGLTVFGILAYGWLPTAWAVLRRAARVGGLSRAIYRGLAVALAFVLSLFGGFWAVTAWWRSYFFDSRVVPFFAITLGLALMSGCANTITYGDLRRRELFHAMLVAWVLGLALMWRWWSRRRPRSP